MRCFLQGWGYHLTPVLPSGKSEQRQRDEGCNDDQIEIAPTRNDRGWQGDQDGRKQKQQPQRELITALGE